MDYSVLFILTNIIKSFHNRSAIHLPGLVFKKYFENEKVFCNAGLSAVFEVGGILVLQA